jgi:hypothetical protein
MAPWLSISQEHGVRSRTRFEKLSNYASISIILLFSLGNRNWDYLVGLIPGPIRDLSEVAMWLETISTLIAAFLDLFRNKDDKVKENSYGYSREWPLKAVPEERYLGYDFDGGGGGHFLFSSTFMTSYELVHP